MFLVRRGLLQRRLDNWKMIRNFAKKKSKKDVIIVERDEYDVKTALELLKACSVSPIDESIDILIK